MNLFRNILAAGVVMTSVATASANATTLKIGDGWTFFLFNGVGADFTDTFTFDGPVEFRVTDVGFDGDQFAITINGQYYGRTSTPVNDATQIGGDFDVAFASPKYSHAAYRLGAGSYTVTGTVVQSPYGLGGGGVEVVASPVPEPAAWALMLLGVAGLGGALRARRRVALVAA